MYGIAIEYGADGGPPDPLARATNRAVCYALLMRQPGFRRRVALMADGWHRVVDLFLFERAEAARAVLASDAWRTCVAAHPACRDAAPALLVSECPYGGRVVLLRAAVGPARGDRDCWRDHLASAEPAATLW